MRTRLLSTLLLITAVDAQTWRPAYISPRSRHVMTYDAARHQIILFGGENYSSHWFSDTWVWDGSDWILKATKENPPAGGSGALTYDAAHQQSVLFTGESTWLWDGSGWTEKKSSQPPRFADTPAMAFHAARGQAVLVGLHETERNGAQIFTMDTWLWDGAKWTQKRSETTPPARVCAALAYDDARHEIVLFGGRPRSGLGQPIEPGGWLSDTWVWNGVNRTRRHPAVTPPARGCGDMAFDPAANGIVMFGGTGNNGLLSDTWIWNGSTWSNPKPAVTPPARTMHRLAYDSSRQRLVMFGGVAGDPNAETWIWDGGTWTRQNISALPEARDGTALAYDAQRGEIVLFGGVSTRTGGSDFSDTWVWDGRRWILKKPVNSPPARSAHALVYDSSRHLVVLLGGYSQQTHRELSDTWVWNGENWFDKTPAASPPPRAGHAMAYDNGRSTVLLFGGSRGDSVLSDTWLWNGVAWARKTPAHAPAARMGHTMAYDAARGNVVLFGGAVPAPGSISDDLERARRNHFHFDTWTWNGDDWTVRNDTGMPDTRPRAEQAMAYDDALSAIVMSGGTAGDETWIWNGAVWKQLLPDSTPGERQTAGMAYDAKHSQLVLFGGARNRETWLFR